MVIVITGGGEKINKQVVGIMEALGWAICRVQYLKDIKYFRVSEGEARIKLGILDISLEIELTEHTNATVIDLRNADAKHTDRKES